MKKDLLQSIKIIILGVLLAAGFAYAQTPPTGNIPAPINASSLPQLKAGGLRVGNVSNGPFIVSTTSLLYGDTKIGSPANPKNLSIASVMGIGVSDDPSVPHTAGFGPQLTVTLNGSMSVDGSVKTTSLAHSASPYNLRQVCVDGAGVLFLCALPTPTPCHGSQVFNSSGTFTVFSCMSSLSISVWGGGGGGGGGGGIGTGNIGTAGGATGGGGGGYSTTNYIIPSGTTSLSVTVGSGGSSGGGGGFGSDGSVGAAGGSSSVAGATTIVTAGGGGGGKAGQGNGALSTTSGGAGGSGNTSNGGAGIATTNYSTSGSSGGSNGASGSGSGGAGAAAPSSQSQGNAGGSGTGPAGAGGGGSGAKGNGVSPHSGGGGGSGAGGRVIISW